MDGATTDCGAFDETVVFLSHFKDLHDPRQQGKDYHEKGENKGSCGGMAPDREQRTKSPAAFNP
jgi:hypothetical protein